MNKPKRSFDKYWTGTKVFDHIQYELDLEDYIQHVENSVQHYAELCIMCDRKKLPFITFESFIREVKIIEK